MRQLKITQSITNRDSASLERYLHEISKLEMITMEQESHLARCIRGGDDGAVATLAKANLRFVVSVAKQYQFQGLSLPDLINEGNLGLIKAARRFDETKGFKFISYAVWWIRQTIIQAINDQSRMVRLPSNKVGMRNRIQRASSQLEQALERDPSAEEVAEMLTVSTTEVQRATGQGKSYQSLDSPLSEGADISLLDLLVNDEADNADAAVFHTQSLHTELQRCMGSLPQMQKDVLCFFYGIGQPQPLSLQDIGTHYQLTTERVRQIKEKALKQLRSPDKKGLLKSYL